MSALTKILIVLQLVFSIAVSVLLVLMVKGQDDYRKSASDYRLSHLAASAQLTQVNGDLQAKNSQLTTAQADAIKAREEASKARLDATLRGSSDQTQILKLSGEVAAKDTQIAALTAGNETALKSLAAKDAELKDLRPQVSKMTMSTNELARRNNELENQVRAAQQAIQKLQDQLVVKNQTGGATLNGAGSQVSMLTASSGAAVASAPAINAKISNVMATSGRTLIEMPLGTRDGIQQNQALMVYRSSGFVADAVVQRVTADTAVAVITKTKEGQSVQAGDTVSTVGK